MSTILVFRLLLIPGALLVFFLVAFFTKSPKAVWQEVLKVCWTVGAANFLVDIIQEYFGFWHYTIGNLFFGYPFDLYIAVSLVLGGAIPLLYWRLQFSYPLWIAPVNFILPLYFLFEDFFVVGHTGTMVVMWDSPYWWVSDLISLCFILGATYFVFYTFLRNRTATQMLR